MKYITILKVFIFKSCNLYVFTSLVCQIITKKEINLKLNINVLKFTKDFNRGFKSVKNKCNLFHPNIEIRVINTPS